LINALKKNLRAAGVTYAHIARQLGVSEASVKRWLSTAVISLERLESICEMTDTSFAELARSAEVVPEPVTRLNPEQEMELTRDPRLLLVTMLILNNWSPAEIEERYTLSETEITGRLLMMDKLGLIDLLPGNRVRRRVARHFTWRQGGPVQRYFEQQLRHDFFDNDFAQSEARLRFSGGLLARESLLRLHIDLENLMKKLDGYIQDDADLPKNEKLAVGAVFAVRPWEVPAFQSMKRDERDGTS
jgi:transcriptional regulator with XRE-family HTH domain